MLRRDVLGLAAATIATPALLRTRPAGAGVGTVATGTPPGYRVTYFAAEPGSR